MTTTIKNTIIILASVVIGIFAINFLVQKITSSKIEKQYIKITEHKEKVKKYKLAIIELKSNIASSDSIVAILEVENDSLMTTITVLEKYKITKKDGTIIKINTINDLSVNGLDSFFTDRFNNIP
jgi:hypothetical protein